MAIQFSLNNFPYNVTVKDACGLPWGCVVQPFYPIDKFYKKFLATSEDIADDDGSETESSGTEKGKSKSRSATTIPQLRASEIARCGQCFGYINPFAKFHRGKWTCALCGFHKNKLPERYLVNPLRVLPEMNQSLIEYLVDDVPPGTDPLSELLIFVAVVDTTGRYEALELIKNGLLAAVDTLPPGSLFALMTYSDTIGLFDLRSSIPLLKRLPIPPNGRSPLGIEEVFPHNDFLVPLNSAFEQNITAAIESLQHLGGVHLTETTIHRGLGTALQTLVNYLRMLECKTLNARVMTFVCGAPNHGLGALRDDAASSFGTAGQHDAMLPQTPFYRELARQAAEAGACIDLVVIADPPETPAIGASQNSLAPSVGLPSIKFLSLFTGGNISIYRSTGESTLPQDIFRSLSQPMALHGLLRLRTSPEFRVAGTGGGAAGSGTAGSGSSPTSVASTGAFGALVADDRYESLWCVEGCDERRNFAFDFEFTSGGGFGTTDLAYDGAPTVQMAFAYTHVPALDSTDRRITRRLRVHTIQAGIARSAAQVYREADPDAIMALLTHKIVRASLDEGLHEARALLRDWLTVVLTHYNEHIASTSASATQLRPTFGIGGASPAASDLAFTKYPNLRKLPRLVFALSKNAIMSDTTPTDHWVYLQSLYGSLSPRELHLAIYPDLAVFGAPNNLSSQALLLSRATVATAGTGRQLFLVDALTVIAVFYGAGTDDLPFPPPRGTLLSKMLAQKKRDRGLTPLVFMLKEGLTPDARALFESFLIEEETTAGPSYERFLDTISEEIGKLLRGG